MPIWYVNPAPSRTAGLRSRLAAIKSRRAGTAAIASRGAAHRRSLTSRGQMPRPYTNPKRKTRRKAKGRVKISRNMPKGLKRYWRAHNAKFKKRRAAPRRRRRKNATLTHLVANPRRKARRPRRQNSMARRYGKKRRRRAAKKAWATRRSKFSARRRAALKGWRKKRGGKRRRPRYSAKVGFARSVRRKRRRRSGGGRRRARRAAPRRRRRRSRSAAARKAWRTRRRKYGAGGRHFTAGRNNPRRRHRRRRRNPSGYRRRRRRRRNAYAPVLANPRRRHRRRRNPSRRRSRSRRRGVLSGFRMRRNPLGGIMATVKAALPIVGGMIGGGLLVSQAGTYIKALDKLGTHKDPVLHALAVVAGGFATAKIGFLAKHRTGIMAGLGVNLLRSLIRTYAPANMQAMIGMGAYYEQMGQPFYEQMGTGDYVETGAEEDLGEYIETGEYVETGAYEELGADGGGQMLAPVPQARMLAPVPTRSMVRNVPQWSPAADNLNSLYTGVFGGTGWGY